MFDWLPSAVVGGFLGAVVAYSVGFFGLTWRISRVESIIERLELRFNSQRGNAAKAEQQDEFMAALTEAAGILQTGGIDQKKGELAALAIKYPSVALKLGRTLGIKL